jgi:hypothetical protein
MQTQQNHIGARRHPGHASQKPNQSVRFARKTGIAALFACVCGLSMARPVAAQTYQFTNFDGPGDHTNGTTINGIGSNGVEVGFSANATGITFTNFLRDPNGNTTLLNISPFAQANGVNAAGAVVGTDGNGNAFSFSGGVTTLLLPANPGVTASQVAFGINDAGKIVGQYVDVNTGNAPGFLDANGMFRIYNPLPNSVATNVQGINNKDQAIGFYSTDDIHQHGFLWNTDTNVTTLLNDPNTARTASGGLFLTQFLGINDNGEAVGYYQTDNGSQYGFLFNTLTDTYTFLDDPLAASVNGVQITQITGIDNHNDLAGFYIDANGVQHGFFAAPSVPEPGPVALLIGAGLSGMGLLARRRRVRA